MVLNKIKNGVEYLLSFSSLPLKIMKEALDFASRNSLGIIKADHHSIDAVCPMCLKAHLIKKASETNQDKAVVEILVNMGEYGIGHEGYYMDKGRLIKI